MDNIFTWCGHDWTARYCMIHKTDGNYYSPECVSIDNNGYLHLKIKKQFATMTCDDGSRGASPWCCGRVECNTTTSYGTYIWHAKMPAGSSLWPALWLCGREQWPPEIDCVEGYSANDSDSYYNGCSMNLKTDVHYKQLCNNLHIGGKGFSSLLYLLFHKEFDEWKIVWTPKEIKIYWNGIKIRSCKKSEVISYFNSENKMYAIMNLAVQNKKDNFYNDMDYLFAPDAELIVKDYKYIPQ